MRPLSSHVRKVLLSGALALALAALPTAPAAARAFSVQAGAGPTFPNRTLTVSVPRSFALTPDAVHVTENGQAVPNVSVDPVMQNNLGHLGVMLAIDSDWSLAGKPVQDVVAAARALAAQRSGDEEIGVDFADGTTAPLTSNPQLIAQALSHSPSIGGYSELKRTKLAIDQLKAANVAGGAVVFISDDIDRDPRYTPEWIAAYARAAHVRIFVVRIGDDSDSNPRGPDLPLTAMSDLATATGGTYAVASPQTLSRMYQEIEAGLNNQYTLSYRSSQHSGGTIAFSVRVDGLGTYKGSYRAFVASQPGQSFWSSQHLFTLAALISAALVGLAAAVLLTHFNKGESLRRRVTAYVPEAPPEPVLVPDIPATDHITELLSRRRWWPTFEQKVDVGAMKRSPKQLVYITVGGSLLVAVLMKLATGDVLPPVGAMLAPPLLVRLLVNRAATKQRNLFLDQFPGLIHETAGAMRTGRSLVEALGGVTGNADEPSRREFTTALADERAGRHIEDALRTIGERMQCDEIEQVAVVAALHRRTGANITEVLDRVAETARQRGEIRRELRGLTAQARMSRNVLVALPPLVVFALSTIAGSFEKPLYNTTPGLILLGVCIAMIATGAKVMKAIVNIEE